MLKRKIINQIVYSKCAIKKQKMTKHIGYLNCVLKTKTVVFLTKILFLLIRTFAPSLSLTHSSIEVTGFGVIKISLRDALLKPFLAKLTNESTDFEEEEEYFTAYPREKRRRVGD